MELNITGMLLHWIIELQITKKLLSERTFTKKELEIIDWYLTEYETQEGVDKEADRLRKKVSELLKKKQ